MSSYLFRDGTTLDSGDVYPPSAYGGYNDGDDMWEKFVSKYENIVLVLSGHDPCDNIIVSQDKGEAGNTVTQMLIDPQGLDASIGATGLVALLHFSEDGKQLQVNYYSTAKKLYFGTRNQFTLTLDVPESDDETSVGADTSSAAASDTSAGPETERNGSIIYIIAAVAVIALVTAVFLIIRKKRR